MAMVRIRITKMDAPMQLLKFLVVSEHVINPHGLILV